MKTERKLEGRSLRFREIYDEKRFRSGVEFAEYTGIKQPTMANYLVGARQPSDESCRKIHDALPEYSLMWILTGEGDKRMQSDTADKSSEVLIEHQSRTEQMTKIASHLAELSERLFAYMTRCESLENQLREAVAKIHMMEVEREATK